MSRLRDFMESMSNLLSFAYEIRRRKRFESRPDLDLDSWFEKYASQWGVERVTIQSELKWLATQIGVKPGQLLPEDSFDNVLSTLPDLPIDDGLSMTFGFAEKEMADAGISVTLASVEDYLRIYGAFLSRKKN